MWLMSEAIVFGSLVINSHSSLAVEPFALPSLSQRSAVYWSGVNPECAMAGGKIDSTCIRCALEKVPTGGAGAATPLWEVRVASAWDEYDSLSKVR
jgi:hypothetical protein